MFPLYGPGQNINLCKEMPAQAKAMKSTWLTASVVGAGNMRFHGTKKHLAKGEELNDLVTNAVKDILKPNKRVKYNIL